MKIKMMKNVDLEIEYIGESLADDLIMMIKDELAELSDPNEIDLKGLPVKTKQEMVEKFFQYFIPALMRELELPYIQLENYF